STFNELKNKMNQSQYGGAVLLGVKAPVVKAHGSSDSAAVYYTLKQIHKMLEEKMIPDLVAYFEEEAKKTDGAEE
ncbi:Fatty acid/phospholipid synthesis protein, partial [Liquorilactobacillus mali KCTC 3596 = DSM 20444]